MLPKDSEKGLRREELLTYVREHLQRDISSSRRGGVTAWALLAATGWLILELVRELRQDQAPGADWFIAVMPFTLPLLWWGFEYCTSIFPVRYISKLDYRLAATVNRKRALLILVVQYGPLAILPVLFLWFVPYESVVAARVAWLNGFIFCAAVLVIWVIIVLQNYLYRLFGETMHLREPEKPAKSTFSGRASIAFIALVYFSMNAFALAEGVIWLDSDNALWSSVYMLLLTAGIYILLSLLVTNIPNSTKLKDLERLERDIVVYGMEVDEIVESLERIFLDYEVNSWVEKKRKSLREFYGGSISIRKQLLRQLKELKSIASSDPDAEEMERIESLRKRVRASYAVLIRTDEKYKVLFEGFERIVTALKKLHRSDPYVLQLIEGFEASVRADFERNVHWTLRLDKIYREETAAV